MLSADELKDMRAAAAVKGNMFARSLTKCLDEIDVLQVLARALEQEEEALLDWNQESDPVKRDRLYLKAREAGERVNRSLLAWNKAARVGGRV